MKLVFSEHAWEDYLYWQRADRKILKRINHLAREIQRAPTQGIGKPEPLKHGLSGYPRLAYCTIATVPLPLIVARCSPSWLKAT